MESPSKKSRKWKLEETNLLIDLVEKNYLFLTDGLHPGKKHAIWLIKNGKKLLMKSIP